VHGWLIWTIVLFQVWAYFAAHFIEFKAEGPLFRRDTGQQVGFFEYYHYNTTHMVRIKNSTRGGSANGAREELGKTGYFYRGLGILGFVLGGVIVPLVQRALPYCPLCQRYMKTKALLQMPAAGKLAAMRVSGKFNLDTSEHQEQLTKALAVLKQASEALTGGRADELRECIRQNHAKTPGRVPVYAELALVYCRQCWQGTYTAAIKNNNNYQTALAQTLASGNVEPAIVQAVIDARSTQSPAAAPVA
jgi:hypothetical protein